MSAPRRRRSARPWVSVVVPARNEARNLEITLDQYRAGTVSYLNVVIAQTSALTSERTLLDVRNRQLAAASLLLKNLAGRWTRG